MIPLPKPGRDFTSIRRAEVSIGWKVTRLNAPFSTPKGLVFSTGTQRSSRR